MITTRTRSAPILVARFAGTGRHTSDGDERMTPVDVVCRGNRLTFSAWNLRGSGGPGHCLLFLRHSPHTGHCWSHCLGLSHHSSMSGRGRYTHLDPSLPTSQASAGPRHHVGKLRLGPLCCINLDLDILRAKLDEPKVSTATLRLAVKSTTIVVKAGKYGLKLQFIPDFASGGVLKIAGTSPWLPSLVSCFRYMNTQSGNSAALVTVRAFSHDANHVNGIYHSLAATFGRRSTTYSAVSGFSSSP